MAIELQQLDLAGRGECVQTALGGNRQSHHESRPEASSEPRPLSSNAHAQKPEKYIPPPIFEATGRTGSTRHKQNCREWCFFPACERQFSLVLDYWAAKSWDTYHEIELLEHHNRAQNLDDYKKRRPDNEYGKKKEELMERLTKETKVFLSTFNLANALMHQHSPSTTSVWEYRQWAHLRLAPSPEPTDYFFAAENYKALGETEYD
ncbi:hypothetical protein QBC40DRAFT_328398 [Triangularia verruculosa]|uniref:Uncharacterized protein n=1 Tax=Triangularia verruculosa TaxID=2587418 RepID=A0AAN6XGA0_9PEZI|nr:hypothetical protein QBC40DRAFT_328398 [Triangularia verruculosa]